MKTTKPKQLPVRLGAKPIGKKYMSVDQLVRETMPLKVRKEYFRLRAMDT